MGAEVGEARGETLGVEMTMLVSVKVGVDTVEVEVAIGEIVAALIVEVIEVDQAALVEERGEVVMTEDPVETVEEQLNFENHLLV